MTTISVDLRIERTIARFLATPEDWAASWMAKPGLEDECLRSVHGVCSSCRNTGPLWRYQIDPDHVPYLACDCGDGPYGPCDRCRQGAPERSMAVACDADQDDRFDELCRWAELLCDARAPWPWLCSPCWRDETEAEREHIRLLRADA